MAGTPVAIGFLALQGAAWSPWIEVGEEPDAVRRDDERGDWSDIAPDDAAGVGWRTRAPPSGGRGREFWGCRGRGQESRGDVRGSEEEDEWKRKRPQSAQAAAGTAGEVDAGESVEERAPILGQRGRRLRSGGEQHRRHQPNGDSQPLVHGLEQATCDLELRGGVARGEQAVVANFHEARGKDVLQEAVDEDVGRERQGGIALGAEMDAVVGEVEQPLVGEPDLVRVATEVLIMRSSP